jgi:ketosteroid isomerase-like protein
MKKLSKAHLEEWMAAFGQSWQNADPVAAVALFDDDCAFYPSPFDLPFEGKDAIYAYWAQIPSIQTNIQFHYQIFETRSLTAVVYWQVYYTLVGTGEPMELNGVMEVKFGTSGLCKQVREWWHARVVPPLAY